MTFNTLARIRTSVLFFCLLFSCSTIVAQNQTINAVYAGTAYEYDQSSDAGEMVRTDYVFYFRPNSSFCNELDKPDWQKKVNGTYSITGNQLKMKFLNDGSEKIILLSVTGETGQSGAATFIKLNISNTVPTGFYKYVRSSGKQDGFYFTDGKFKRTTSLTTVSGGSNNTGDNGSYTINQSQLALKYDNGRTTNYSFFTNADKKSIVVINGEIYYSDEEELAKHVGEANPAAVKQSNALEAGMNLLKQANQAHGGKSLDGLTTLKAVMNTNNLTLTMQADYTRQIVRLESALQGNTILLEQMEGNSGWSFDGTGYATLSPQRVVELKRYLYCGLLGLKSDVLAKSTATLQTQQYELSSIMVAVNSMRVGYIINNRNNRLEALIMVDPLSGTTTFTYSDFKKTGNILLPYTEIMQAGKHAQTITYESYEVNPTFPANTWAKPK
ncbi:hypothetical protein FAM09_00935 [Niastella caeni]|uniref:Uncharacterized protein n=1 Tax=Niastella caeni TaxID=2569763 RepID=A0A4S8HZA8_9BACT|nr:hypothetical protein [Niastella caeni]THU40711.1 hypothetical protein FAM09_00935 [Niastella caeni]